MPREILVDWTTAAGGGFVSVFMFDQVPTVASQRTALGEFLDDLDGAVLDNSATWTIRTVGRDLDDATGALTDDWSEPTVKTGTGAATGEPVADATQLLLQWRTSQVVNGRFLRGRTFIPGLTTGVLVNGNVGAAFITSIQGFQAALIATVTGLGVWHRPIAGSGGVFHLATSGTVWPELAVLRRRRT